MEELDVNQGNTEQELESGGNLPSVADEENSVLKGFEITDEIKAKYLRNGKMLGRFDNAEAVFQTLESVENKYSSLMRDIKNGKYQEVTADTQVADNTATVQAEELNPLVQKYVQQGFELTDDILQEAQAKGLDLRDVKLAAIEIKEKVTKAHSLVGGADEYNAMLAWAGENLSDAEKKAFDADLVSGAGEWAIKGLYNEYKARSKGQTEQYANNTRMQGESSSQGAIRPYSTLQEAMRDREYVMNQGRHDRAAKALYEKRMSMTPDSVIFG